MIAVDIVIVCRNDLVGLRKTLDSIVEQEFHWAFVKIIDGDSSDGTVEYLSSLKSDNIEYISEQDNGIYDAMNKGIRLCSSDFVMFLNAGDTFYSKSSLKKIVAKIKYKQKVIFARTAIMDGNKIVKWMPSEDVADLSKWLVNKLPCHPSMLFPKVFYQHNKYDHYLPIAADNDYKLRALNECDGEYISEPFVRFYIGGVSTDDANLDSIQRRFRQRMILDLKYTNLNILYLLFQNMLIFSAKYVISWLRTLKSRL